MNHSEKNSEVTGQNDRPVCLQNRRVICEIAPIYFVCEYSPLSDFNFGF